MSFLKKKKEIKPDLGVLLSEFNKTLMLIVDKSLLISSLVTKVKQISGAESVSFFLLDENTGKYKLQNSNETVHHVLTGKDRLINWLSVNEKELVISHNPAIVPTGWLPWVNLPQEQRTKYGIRSHPSEALFST